MADDDADPLDWELEQLQKLKRLAEAYGWGEDHPQYKAKLKGIQAQGKERLSAALRKKQGGEKKKAGSITWESCGEIKAKGFDEAKAQLKNISEGTWVPDRRCPESRSEGMVVRRFKCTDKKAGKVFTARLIDLSKGDFRMQRGNVEDIPQEEPASEPPSDTEKDGEEDADAESEGDAGPSSRRGAEAPAKRSASAAAKPPEPAAAVGKRPRKQRKQ